MRDAPEPQADPSPPQADVKPSKPWYLQIHTQILIALALAVVVAGGMRAVDYGASFQVKAPTASQADVAKTLARDGVREVAPVAGQAEHFEVSTDVAAFEPSQKAAEAAGYTVTSVSRPVAYEVLNFLGALFLRLLKMIILPLVVASVVTGILGIGNTSALGRLGAMTMVFYTLTTALAVVAGMVVVNVMNPGAGQGERLAELMGSAKPPTLQPTPLSDVLLGVVPSNLAEALAGGDLLSVIFASILFGLAMVVVGEPAKPLGRVFEALNAVVMRVTDWVMATAPVGVFALLSAVLLKTGFGLLADLARYMAAVVVGLGVHALITLPLILWVFGRTNPLRFARAMVPALLTAFSTSSSSATLPVTMESVTDRAGHRPQTASFVLPLGATINMDGTALYESVAAIFIAQLYGIDLTMGQQVTIFLTATLAAVGAAGIPSAGLVTMIMVLKAVGLPLEGIALIAGVDRLLDMCRTTVNVWGDSVGVAVIDRFQGSGAPPEASASDEGMQGSRLG